MSVVGLAVDVAVVVVLQRGVEHVHHELAAAGQPQRCIPRRDVLLDLERDALVGDPRCELDEHICVGDGWWHRQFGRQTQVARRQQVAQVGRHDVVHDGANQGQHAVSHIVVVDQFAERVGCAAAVPGALPRIRCSCLTTGSSRMKPMSTSLADVHACD